MFTLRSEYRNGGPLVPHARYSERWLWIVVATTHVTPSRHVFLLGQMVESLKFSGVQEHRPRPHKFSEDFLAEFSEKNVVEIFEESLEELLKKSLEKLQEQLLEEFLGELFKICRSLEKFPEEKNFLINHYSHFQRKCQTPQRKMDSWRKPWKNFTEELVKE